MADIDITIGTSGNPAGAQAVANAIGQSLASDPDAQDQWEYSGTVRRDHPLVNDMAGRLGKSTAQVDDIFRYAETL